MPIPFPPPPTAGALPIGNPLRIVLAYSTAIIECQCPAKTLIVLACTGPPAPCPACGKMFGIAKAGTIEVGELRMPTAADLVSQ